MMFVSQSTLLKATPLLIILGMVVCFNSCTSQTKGIAIYKPLTPIEYQSIINSDNPVLIDFSASWCNPCKMLSPILYALEKDPDIKSKLTIISLDSKVHENIFNNEGIEAFPTLVLYKKGEVLWRQEGYMAKDMLKGELLERLKIK